MKIEKSFILREIAGDYVIVPVKETALEFNGLITVNEVGAFIWKCLQKETTPEQIAEAICEEYEVEYSQAEADTKEFIGTLKDRGILGE